MEVTALEVTMLEVFSKKTSDRSTVAGWSIEQVRSNPTIRVQIPEREL